jgi:hypothetical protein
MKARFTKISTKTFIFTTTNLCRILIAKLKSESKLLLGTVMTLSTGSVLLVANSLGYAMNASHRIVNCKPAPSDLLFHRKYVYI